MSCIDNMSCISALCIVIHALANFIFVGAVQYKQGHNDS